MIAPRRAIVARHPLMENAMKSAIAVLGMTASLFAFPAAAQMNMSSAYVGASIGQSERKDACGVMLIGGSCDEKDTAWRLLGGMQINRNFAAEIGYHNLGEINVTAGAASATSKSSVWELVGIGAYPFANTFAVYGKLGGYRGRTHLSSNTSAGGDDTNYGLTYGLGLQWDGLTNVGVRAEWQRYDNVGGNAAGKGDINVMSVGAVYRFR
jgi:OOP family OmpA-OmpF porin